MTINDRASGLGLEFDEETTHKIYAIKKYVVIIERFRGSKKKVVSNETPIADIHKAKEIAMKKLTVKADDSLTFRCLEITEAIVPIETLIQGTIHEIQSIHSKWLNHEELLALTTKYHENET
jgi:hypothetical protein